MPTPDNRDDELLPEAETREKQTKENIKESMEEDTEEEYVRRTAPLWAVVVSCALGLLIIDLQTYGGYLFGKEPMPWAFLVVANILCCLWLLFITVRKTCAREREENSGRKGS